MQVSETFEAVSDLSIPHQIVPWFMAAAALDSVGNETVEAMGALARAEGSGCSHVCARAVEFMVVNKADSRTKLRQNFVQPRIPNSMKLDDVGSKVFQNGF